jgi:hypothetical protein
VPEIRLRYYGVERAMRTRERIVELQWLVLFRRLLVRELHVLLLSRGLRGGDRGLQLRWVQRTGSRVDRVWLSLARNRTTPRLLVALRSCFEGDGGHRQSGGILTHAG